MRKPRIKERIAASLESLHYKVGAAATVGYENRDGIGLAVAQAKDYAEKQNDELKRTHKTLLEFERHCAERMKMDAADMAKQFHTLAAKMQASTTRLDALSTSFCTLDSRIRELEEKAVSTQQLIIDNWRILAAIRSVILPAPAAKPGKPAKGKKKATPAKSRKAKKNGTS